MDTTRTGTIVCETCEQTHVAEYHHDAQDGTPVYAVVCTEDWLTEFWYQWAVTFQDND